jgi:hypothetical protein
MGIDSDMKSGIELFNILRICTNIMEYSTPPYNLIKKERKRENTKRERKSCGNFTIQGKKKDNNECYFIVMCELLLSNKNEINISNIIGSA